MAVQENGVVGGEAVAQGGVPWGEKGSSRGNGQAALVFRVDYEPRGVLKEITAVLEWQYLIHCVAVGEGAPRQGKGPGARIEHLYELFGVFIQGVGHYLGDHRVHTSAGGKMQAFLHPGSYADRRIPALFRSREQHLDGVAGTGLELLGGGCQEHLPGLCRGVSVAVEVEDDIP